MARLIVEHSPCPLADREFRPFLTLANSIISQQLSAKAADTMERVGDFMPHGMAWRFIVLHYNGHYF
jgi:3-methyladenine DNA glycosylase/8-oxoguanine DNA glycosylase